MRAARNSRHRSTSSEAVINNSSVTVNVDQQFRRDTFPSMVSYQISIVDPEHGDAGLPVYHLVPANFGPEESIRDVFIYLSATLFQEILPHTNSEAVIARGLKSVRFLGIEIHARQTRKIEVRSFELLWNETCSGFSPLIDVTFFLHSKPRTEKQANGQPGALFNMFLTPVDRRIAQQSQESNQRGTYLPLYYLEWAEISKVARSTQPYVEKQWNSTVDKLFESNDVRYKLDFINNPEHAVYKFIVLFSLLLKKLNFRWSKIIKLENVFKSCQILSDFFNDTKRPYSADDEENDINQGGQWQIILLFCIKFFDSAPKLFF